MSSPVPLVTALSKLPNFDPRTAAVAGIDTHLPPVPADALTPDALRSRFRSPRPWQPEISKERPWTEQATAHASVLVPIVTRQRPMVILTERTTHLSTHSGQVAFPGGKRDDTDTDAVHTALREAHEEIGLEHGFVEVIGELPTYTTGSKFIITPVIALVRPEHVLTLNAYEVADAFEVPLEFLMNPAHHHRHVLDMDGYRREWLSIPYMDGSTERFIWGATAAMLRNLYRCLAA
ncbi:CoA pyrophosphatase [Caenimonas terrae]|uniref:CoA pyrophosphatase n=1 Tax=Caenimonas terrae TaxID=696074 RepID=A0ABW0NIM3_9BURK